MNFKPGILGWHFWQFPPTPALLILDAKESSHAYSHIIALVPRLCPILFSLTLVAAFALPQTARGQQRLEVGGGWSHVTGDFGTDGFNIGAAWWFSKRVTLAADYDSTWDTSTLTNFAFTQAGAITTKSHLQSVVVGRGSFFPPTGRTNIS